MHYAKLILKTYVYVFYSRFSDATLSCNVKDKVPLIYIYYRLR